jgi:hypothetical protein
MRKKQNIFLILFFSAIITAKAIHWFLTGSNQGQPLYWMIFVGAQFITGVVLLLWCWKKWKELKKEESPSP